MPVPVAMNGCLAVCLLLPGRLISPSSGLSPSWAVAAVGGWEVSWLSLLASTLTHRHVIFRERPHPPANVSETWGCPPSSLLSPTSIRAPCKGCPALPSPGACPPLLPVVPVCSVLGPTCRAQKLLHGTLSTSPPGGAVAGGVALSRARIVVGGG